MPGGASNSSNSTNEVINYEIGGTTSEIVQEPGEIEKVSVAVLVNGIYNVQGGGAVDYQERGADELAQLQALVQSAIGFDQTRGDSVEVVSLRFMDYSMDVGEPIGGGFTRLLTDNLGTALRGTFALALVGSVLLLGVRPALNRILQPQALPEGGDALRGGEGVRGARLPAVHGRGAVELLRYRLRL